MAGGQGDEGFVRLRVGDSVQLSGDRMLRLAAFETERYADGRPKEWISTVETHQGGSPHPRALPDQGQSSSQARRSLRLSSLVRDRAGPRTRGFGRGDAQPRRGGEPRAGLGQDHADVGWTLASGESLAREEGPAGGRIIRLARGSKLGPFTVAGAEEIGLSGLKASYDPAYPAVLASLAIALVGICMTFARKLGDMKA